MQKTSESIFQRRLTTIINLKSLLERVPKLALALNECKNGLFKAMKRNYCDSRIVSMKHIISNLINESTEPKKQALEMKFQVCNNIIEMI